VQVRDTNPLEVMALDQFGNAITDVAFTWSAGGPAGTIDETGMFTTGTQAGSYEGLVKVIAIQGEQDREASIDVTITPGPLSSVAVEPTAVTLDIGGTQPFSFSAYDQFGNEIKDVLSSWRAEPNVGTIDAKGVLTTGTKAGAFLGAVRVQAVEGTAMASASADLSILPDPLATIEVQASSFVVEKDTAQQFEAVGFDQYGNQILGLTFPWEATGGDIDEMGIFTARQSGRHEVRASATSRDSLATGSATVEIPLRVSVASTATFWHTADDAPTLPTILDLGAAGFAPGDLLELTYEVPPPGFSYGCGGPFVDAEGTPVMGVFSGSSTLLPTSALARVPDAIDAGLDTVSGPTFYRNEPTDIPEDFQIFSPSGFTIEVPAGATHLFFGTADSLFGDNCGMIMVTTG
jgi:hypothetical protein